MIVCLGQKNDLWWFVDIFFLRYSTGKKVCIRGCDTQRVFFLVVMQHIYLQFDGIHVVSGSLDTSIRVWDVETGACLHTLIGHQSLTSGLELKDNILVSGNADSTVKVWDITTGQCLQTLQGKS